jgi:nucleoside-diphosphate-sugar epimerase
MRTLVIGATGFIGYHIALRLLAGGHEVAGLARSGAAAERLSKAGIEPILGEIEAMGAHARAADATVFAPQLLMDAEYAAVARLLDALEGTGKRFLFTSGTGVLGKRTAGAWDENSYSDYDEDPPFSKLLLRRVETERLVRSAASRGMIPIVVRPPMVWCPGRHNILEWMRASSERTGALCYVGAGLNCYTDVHVADLADLYAAAIERGTPGALYHAASYELPNRALAEILAQRIGCETRSVTVDEAIAIWGKFAVLVVLSVSSRSRAPRARVELGWTPTRTDLIGAILSGAFDRRACAPG